MRLACLLRGHAFYVIREDWLPPTKVYENTRLLQFCRCSWCKETRATITSPTDYESMFSHPDYRNRAMDPEPETT